MLGEAVDRRPVDTGGQGQGGNAPNNLPNLFLEMLQTQLDLTAIYTGYLCPPPFQFSCLRAWWIARRSNLEAHNSPIVEAWVPL